MGTGVTAKLDAVAWRMSPVAGSWDSRLYDGLRVARISSEARSSLGVALGQVGVEAEYLLLLVSSFPGDSRPSRPLAARFLSRLTASLERLIDASVRLEASTQGYLTALDVAYPGVIAASERSSAWWPVFGGYTMPGAPLEMRLRRCGLSYRHALESRLAPHMEAILEQMALMLFALSTLPPAGVAPIASLARGLDELSSALQGEITPRHILGNSGDDRYPGALAAIQRLLALDASGDASLESDIAWARAQYVEARDEETRLAAQTGQEPLRALAAHDAYEWAGSVSMLEGMRRYANAG